MKTINIDGIIGWDVTAADVRQQIRDAKGEDLTIEINSPGGLVTEGIAIFNAIKNAPGKKTTCITGLAASMGSYVALAADHVTAERNAIYMIHNAQMIGVGDHNALRKAADIAEGMSSILASAYMAKTGKDKPAVCAMMDAETFLYGAEIQAEGFCDEMVGPDPEDGQDKAAAVLQVRAAVASAEDLLRRVSTERDTDQAAALLADLAPRARVRIENEQQGAVGASAVKPAKTTKGGGRTMTLEQIKAESPEIVQALRDEGIQAERKRVAGLAAWKGINPDADKAVEEAIAQGKCYDDVAAQLAAAVAKGKATGGDNAAAVTTATASTAGGVDPELADAELAAAAAKAGLKLEDVKKWGGK